jgi:transcriptional regulator with XRE-family HTH domain
MASITAKLDAMTQSSLAERMGVHKSAVSLVLSGARTPSLALLRKLAKVLEVDLGDVDRYFLARNSKRSPR